MRTVYYEPKRQAAKCPACGCGTSKDIGDGARECLQCHAQFEPVEVSFVDSRAIENAIKREEFELRARARSDNDRKSDVHGKRGARGRLKDR